MNEDFQMQEPSAKPKRDRKRDKHRENVILKAAQISGKRAILETYQRMEYRDFAYESDLRRRIVLLERQMTAMRP